MGYHGVLNSRASMPEKLKHQGFSGEQLVKLAVCVSCFSQNVALFSHCCVGSRLKILLDGTDAPNPADREAALRIIKENIGNDFFIKGTLVLESSSVA